MARTDKIPEQASGSLREQIIRAIRSIKDARFPVAEVESLEIGPSFALWGIKPEALNALKRGADPDELSGWAVEVGGWHHQLRFSTGVAAFARSGASPEHPSELMLEELGISSLATRIDTTFNWIEEDAQRDPEKHGLPSPYDDPLVRLLELPSLNVTAFMLLDEARDEMNLTVLESPADDERLSPRKMLTPRSFLSAVAARPFPRGII